MQRKNSSFNFLSNPSSKKIDLKKHLKKSQHLIKNTFQSFAQATNSAFKMDLKQRKLSKSEWDSIEIPVSSSEIEILQLITQGYSDVNIKINKTNSLFTFLKIECNTQNEDYLYNKYFADKIKKIVSDYGIDCIKFSGKNKSPEESSDSSIYVVNVGTIVKLKSADQIRLGRDELFTRDNDMSGSDIYEFILCKHLENMFIEKQKNSEKWMFHYYTLNKLIQNNVEKVNKHIKNIVQTILSRYENEIDILSIVKNASEYIEKNSQLLRYSDLQLYEHQKEIFSQVKRPNPKLVLYIAPTGTGKTLTPLGLSENNKVIFVCAARHVGLALARAAISINKRVAFAFGCSSADDVRLHYFAAKDYTVNKRTGKIKNVDNSVGVKVEIMICDIRSYLYAMYYMLAFNPAHQIITYWDEPTISLDYADHELHQIIKKNWKENIIPNVVLSSATLPKIHELSHTIADFNSKFYNSIIVNIVSHDCKKTIPMINNNGYIVMPHYLSDNYEEIQKIVEHCENNLTLLRYFDLKEASNFILFVEKHDYTKSSAKFNRNFASVDDIDMKSLKLHYLKVLKNIIPENWTRIWTYFNVNKEKRILPNNSVDVKGNKLVSKMNSLGPGSLIGSSSSTNVGQPIQRTVSQVVTHVVSDVSMSSVIPDTPGSCGVYVTTKDAHTLTDGPTIFLANDVQKISKFCIQQSNIPASVMKDILEKIEFNNKVNERISQIEEEILLQEQRIANKLLSGSDKSNSKDKKNKVKIAEKIIDKTQDTKILQMREQIDTLKNMIKSARLNDLFIPNTLTHLNKWADGLKTKNAFTCNIDDDTISSIMLLKDVEDSWKVLLLLGIGVFTQHKSSDYTEIMKKLADQQKLYLIIADSDYIYGTNYQFCHGYLSKDMKLTQEKIIQAMGRIGRNNIQQEYSIRFRDDEHINTLFTAFASEDKPEVLNMNILFNSKKIHWNGNEYIEVDEGDFCGDDFDLDNESNEDSHDEDDITGISHGLEDEDDVVSDAEEDDEE